MDSFSESLQYITNNVESQFELRVQEFDNTYNENIAWLETVSKDCKTAFESTIERIFLAEKKTKAKQSRELFTPLKEFNYSAPDRVALSRQLATPASAYRPRTRAAVKQLQTEEITTANKENQIPTENKVEEKIVEQVKKPAEIKKAAAKGKSKVQAAVEKMEEKIIEERFGKKKVEEKPEEKVVEQPKTEEVVEESEKKEDDDEASEVEEDKPQGRAGRLKATRTTAAAKKAAAAAKRAATIAEKKARAAREAEEREKAEKEEQERQAKLEEEKAAEKARLAAEAKEKKRLEKEEKERQAKIQKEKAEQEEKERLEREQAEREEKEREAKAKKAAEEAENQSEEEAPAPKKKGRAKKTYVKKTTTRGKKRARTAESEDESEAQSASEEVPKPKTKKAKLSNEKSDAEHVVEDVKMDEAKEEKVVAKEEPKKDEEDEFIVDVVGTATPAKRVALPAPAVDDAIMAYLPIEFEENIEIITTKTPSKPKAAPKLARISTDSQDEVDVVMKPKTADFIVHEEAEPSSTVVASVVESLHAEVTIASEPAEKENAMQIDSDAESQSETSQGPSTLTDSSEDAAKAEKKQKRVGFAASQSKPALATSNSSKTLDVNDKLKRAADNRQMLEQKKREELEKKRAQAVSKVEASKKAREEPVKKVETASSIAAKKMEVEETKEDEIKKAEEAAKEEDAQSRRKRFLVQSLEEKKHNSASREAVETAPKPQGPAPAPQGPKLSLLAFLKKPPQLTSETPSTTQTQSTSAASPTDLEDSESSSGSEKESTSSVDLKSAANVIPKPSGVPKPFSDLRKFIRDGSDEHAAPAPKPAVVAPTPVVAAPTPVVESKPLPSASNFGFKPISRENSANNISAPSSIKSAASSTSTNGPSSLAPPSLNSLQSQARDAQMMPPPQSPSSIRATSIKSFIPIKLAQSPKASPHSPQPVLSPKPSASMLYSPSPPRSPLRPRGFLDSPECQCPILDYCSDDDSDSEIDLPVPAWTQKENLYKALEMQTTIDPDEIFGKELGKNIDLNAIFGPNPRRPAYKK